jgi:biopolymer transport protein ExbD
MIVKADTHAEHGWVVAIMDIAKTIGIDRLAIATVPQEPQQ